MKNHNRPLPVSVINAKVYDMYLNGANYVKISQVLNIPVKSVEPRLLTHINYWHISTEQLEKDRADVIALNTAMNRNRSKDLFKEEQKYLALPTQTGYGFKDSLKGLTDPIELSFISKLKLAVYHLIFFWR